MVTISGRAWPLAAAAGKDGMDDPEEFWSRENRGKEKLLLGREEVGA